MSEATAQDPGMTAGAEGAARRAWLARALRHPSFVVGAALTLLLVGMALVSLVWTPYEPTAMALRDRYAPVSWSHWLGTDKFGRDVLSNIMAGAQLSIAVGVVAVLIGVTAGSALGLWAAARKGWVEELVMRFSDFAFAFPAILSAIMITVILGPGAVNSILAIGIFNIPVFARLTRAAANGVWTREYVLAARAAGKGGVRITVEHVVPNILSVILVQATIQFAIAILAEAALSYLGIGSQPPQPSWGRMLNEAQLQMYKNAWLAVYPGIAIALSVLGLNLLGDGLRDLTDPRLVRQR
ncbi:ABC transporter permease [Marinibaculum pumilum]|uniref:ABC transporter permease n=1 Tax=Marinibaculum pumilum TaxID=1766165 RepID=A0ABV7KXK3_9PROT